MLEGQKIGRTDCDSDIGIKYYKGTHHVPGPVLIALPVDILSSKRTALPEQAVWEYLCPINLPTAFFIQLSACSMN